MSLPPRRFDNARDEIGLVDVLAGTVAMVADVFPLWKTDRMRIEIERPVQDRKRRWHAQIVNLCALACSL